MHNVLTRKHANDTFLNFKRNSVIYVYQSAPLNYRHIDENVLE